MLTTILLIGNKCDLRDMRVVTEEDAKEFVQRGGMFFIETLALEEINVETTFIIALTEIYRIVRKKDLTRNEDEGNGNYVALTFFKIGFSIPKQPMMTMKKNSCY